jgi:hypothetical protein
MGEGMSDSRNAQRIGRGWPNPSEPGVPALPLENGFHWMAWASTGALTVGQWDADLWMWVLCYLGCFTEPKDMAHLNYLGIARPVG